MTTKLFVTSDNFIWRQDETFNTHYHLIGWTSDYGPVGNPLPVTGVDAIYVDIDIQNITTFSLQPFTTLNKIQIRGWKSLQTFTVASQVLSTLTELEINGTKINSISQNFTALTDVMLIGNPYLNNIQFNLNTVERCVIVDCPFTSLKSMTACNSMHLEGTSITTIGNGWNGLRYLRLSPKFYAQNFDCNQVSGLKMLVVDEDVILNTAPSGAHVAKIKR